MLQVFDTVLTSNDMSIDRVLNAGLPVALIFSDNEIPADLRRSMDELANKYAGKVLVVNLPRQDAAKTAQKFNVQQFPTLVTMRNNQPVGRQEYVSPADLRAYVTFLAGEGPMPAKQTAPNTAGSKPVTGKGPIKVDEANFEQEVLRSNTPVLVDFWAEWCGPCRMMEPALEKISRQYGDKLKVAKLNVDENPGISGRYGVSGIPTMLIVQNGQEADRLVGALPESALRNRLARWIQA